MFTIYLSYDVFPYFAFTSIIGSGLFKIMCILNCHQIMSILNGKGNSFVKFDNLTCIGLHSNMCIFVLCIAKK